ncbi:two-component regulator propeller domain-containing protein [Pontibacter sp. G13]|uniref:two-component regulator propeller domain-containing protein n=1 Tax=Pontibacter sp. G13 TaxID=3074898 RepID=UPI00288C2099|nr:two-component regulator propeller domain-containing protein [Pontibacter sp. G13]WNJ20639.1 two-component regulator propeller domain-containing protein [Pontibacter sp. G13]
MRLLLLSFILTTCLASQAWAQQVDFEKITTQDGLSHSTVFSICQDGAGYLWFGTRDGLNRYDSYDIQTYYQGDRGLLHDEIIALEAVGDTGLYIGTPKGASYYDYARDTFLTISYNQKSLGRVNDIKVIDPFGVFICTKNGVYRVWGADSVTLVTDKFSAQRIARFEAGLVWVARNNGRLILMDHQGQIVRRLSPQKNGSNKSRVPQLRLNALYTDAENRTWLATNQGLWIYSLEADNFVKVDWNPGGNELESQFIRSLTSDEDGDLWIGTEAGLYIFNPNSGKTEHYNQGFSNQPSTLSDKAVYSTYRSREGIIWIGTYFGGVNYSKPSEKTFHKMMADGGINGLGGKAVSDMIMSAKNQLWIGTEDGGITIIDPKTQQKRYLKHDPQDPYSLSSNNVLSLHQDRQGNVWVGNFIGGLNRYDPSSKRFYHYLPQGKSHQRMSKDVFALFQDQQDRMWIGTRGGLFQYDYDQDTLMPAWPKIFGKRFIQDIGQDRSGDLWFCTLGRGLYRYVQSQDTMILYQKSAYPGLKTNMLLSFFEDSRGQIWLGTSRGGAVVFDPQQEEFTTYGVEEGLTDNNVHQIQEDKQGRIWLSTNRGLFIYSPDLDRFSSANMSYSLPSHQFNLRSSLSLDDGTLMFGTVNGLCYFHPDSISLAQSEPNLHFTGLRLFSEPISPQADGILQQHIDFTDSLVVGYSQNVLGFDFTAIDHLSPGNLHYAYYLEGFENQWNYVADERKATYTNLSPGQYILHLQASLNPKGDAIAQRSLVLTVLPPWWLTRWAIWGYILLLGLILFAYARFSRFLNQQRLNLKVERMEKEQVKELNQHKINFFTYITHEFKTPLTLIISRLDKVLDVESDEHARSQIIPIRRQAARLQHLITQLMEFRRVESDHAQVRLAQGDLVLFVRDTIEAFTPLYVQKQINYRFECSLDVFHAYFDADKLTKILTNILSNAIKNTGELGEINVLMRIEQDSDQSQAASCSIEVLDTGIGMVQSESDKVFMPFYQADPTTNKGSGIGLALVNTLIKLLKGKLTIESSPEQGTLVRIELPIQLSQGQEPFGTGMIRGNKSLVIDEGLFEEEVLLPATSEKSKPEILIVEDNEDLLRFLASHFGAQYRVQTASNGKKALEKIAKQHPDFILSDVMMPEMGGLELCQKLKENEATSHIPLVLLSAQSEVEYKLKGLNQGADAYLPKPFNLREAELIIKNLLATRQSLREFFLQFGHWHGDEIPTNNRDQAFLRNILSHVKSHFSDPDFTVAKLAKEVGISRSLLHQKLRKIADMTASDLIKTIRLQNGARLLADGYNVSEAAYDSGFSDPGYFGRLFKKHFGINPSEYSKEGAHTALRDIPIIESADSLLNIPSPLQEKS